jgi:hypothetical protein
MLEDKWFPNREDPRIVGRVAETRTCDRPASEAKGTTVWKMVPVMEAKIPGSIDVATQPIKPHNQKEICDRFPGAWEFYQEQKSGTAPPKPLLDPAAPVIGTPLDKADFLPREKIALLITLGFSTIEQLAEMDDMRVQNLKGSSRWRKQAIEFLKRT